MLDVLLYHFYFSGVEKPLTIQATDQVQARGALPSFLAMPGMEEYRDRPLDGQTVSHPLKGISTRKINGETYVWVGFDESADGWKKQIIKKNEKPGIPKT